MFLPQSQSGKGDNKTKQKMYCLSCSLSVSNLDTAVVLEHYSTLIFANAQIGAD